MFPAFSKVVTLENLLILLKGALLSLGLAAGSLLIGLAIAILIALLRFSTKKICHIIANIYVEFFRGTPMLVQIMYLFTVVPIVISLIVGHRVRINPVIVGLIALSLNSGAYQAEYIRGGNTWLISYGYDALCHLATGFQTCYSFNGWGIRDFD